MKNATSFTIHKDNLQFLNSLVDSKGRSRSDIVDSILGAYRKFKLKKEISAGFERQNQKDVSEAMSDFQDYLAIVDEE